MELLGLRQLCGGEGRRKERSEHRKEGWTFFSFLVELAPRGQIFPPGDVAQVVEKAFSMLLELTGIPGYLRRGSGEDERQLNPPFLLLPHLITSHPLCSSWLFY